MKILGLSLLRLGDFFQHLPLIDQLQEQGHEVHLLVNDMIGDISGLRPGLQIYTLPRQQMQTLIAYPFANLLSSMVLLQRLVDRLNLQQFDEIHNWTHTQVSAHLMDLLQAPRKLGIHFENGRLPAKMSKALRYLNDNWGPTTHASFHAIDALALSTEQKYPPVPLPLPNPEGTIFFQVFTSDYRKNWNLQKWLALSALLRQQGERVRILCAPFEAMKLQQAGFERKDLAVADLDKLPETLAGAKLVIAGDTSILHYAAYLKVPVMGLYLGPANPRKTAPRQVGSKLLWVKVACSPCRHRDPCKHLQLECEINLSVQQVMNEVMSMLIHQTFERYGDVVVLNGEQTPAGAFVAQQVGGSPNLIWLQLVWEFYLNRDHDNIVAPYGSAARLLLQKCGPLQQARPWFENLNIRLQSSFEFLERISENIWTSMRNFNETGEISHEVETQLSDLVGQLQRLWSETDFITRLEVAANQVDKQNAFIRLRQRKEALEEVHQLLMVQRNLARVVDLELKERGIKDGTRA